MKKHRRQKSNSYYRYEKTINIQLPLSHFKVNTIYKDQINNVIYKIYTKKKNMKKQAGP